MGDHFWPPKSVRDADFDKKIKIFATDRLNLVILLVSDTHTSSKILKSFDFNEIILIPSSYT